MGSFKGNEQSSPKIGEKLKFTEVKEICVNITFLKHLEQRIINVLKIIIHMKKLHMKLLH